MRGFSTLVFLAFVSLACGAPKKLPSYLQFCKRGDPNFDSCTLRLLNNIRPQLIKGIAQLHAPPLDPFKIPALQIDRDTENLQLTATLKNVEAIGAGQYQITKLRTDLKNNVIELGVVLPHLQVSTDYDVKGRILVIPLNGKGTFKGNVTNIQSNVKMSGKVVDRRGKKYLEVTNVVAKTKVGDTHVDPTVSNQRNDLITKSAVDFWENNKRQVLDIVTPVADETTNAIIQQIANRILATIPYETILPQ